jgi:putative transposase
MLKNHSLAKHISDAAWGEFVRQLEYKAPWYGSTVVKADRFFPSSKTCSSCGAVKAKLPLEIRTYHCEACGLTLDREINAAINLAGWTGNSTPAGTRSVAGRRGEIRPKRQRLVVRAHPDEASTETPTIVDA